MSGIMRSALADSRFWIPAFAGMTGYGACRGAKPLCGIHHSPIAKGGYRGIGPWVKWRWAQPTLLCGSPMGEKIGILEQEGDIYGL